MKYSTTYQQIVSGLLNENVPVNTEKLAESCCCSTKTIARRLRELPTEYLSAFDVGLVGDNVTGYQLEGNGLIKLKEEINKSQDSVAWRNREERQLLILLELASSNNYFTKLQTLGLAVQVAESTVLKDIRFLNQSYPGLQIQSSPGIGTQICCSKDTLLNELFHFCYQLFKPDNFLHLSNLGHGVRSIPDFKLACTSNCFFQFMEKKDFPLEEFTICIIEIEKENNLALSDLSYINLYLFFILKNLVYKEASSIDCHDTDIYSFIIGLNVETLQKLYPQILDEESWVTLENSLRKILSAQLSVSWLEFWREVKLQLALLQYRSRVPCSYWDSFLNKNKNIKYQVDIIKKLDSLCLQENNNQWLSLDVLLTLLQPYLIEHDNRIGVILVCVTGTGTALILEKMMERFCPLIKVERTYSLREYFHSEVKNKIIISTIKSSVFPKGTIYIEPSFDRNDWNKIQREIKEGKN